MKIAKKWIGNLFIVIGLALLIGLAFGMKNVQDQQNELVKAFATVKTEASIGEGKQHKSSALQPSEAMKMRDGMEGVLSVPAIDLTAPVLEGASPENLNRALGSISGLDEPGEMNGSYAIAGHQSHVFGKFFNRLDELQKGDVFQFETEKETLSFKVFTTHIVKPEEVSVLKQQSGIALLSLVTCYPENSNAYRLVVQAKRIP